MQDFVEIHIFLLYILNYIVNILFTFYNSNCDIIILGFYDCVFTFYLMLFFNIFVRECRVIEKIKW